MPLVRNKSLKNILADGRLLMTDLSWYFERWNLSWTLKDEANIRDLLVWGQHPVTTGWCSSVKTQVSLNSSWALQMWEMHNRGYSEPVCLLTLIQQLEGTKTRKSGFTWLFSNKQIISSEFQAERRGNSVSENEHLSETSSKFFACASLHMNCNQYSDLVSC